MLLTDSSFANTANIKSTGSVWVVPTRNVATAGFATAAGEVSSIESTYDFHKPYDVTPDNRLRTGNDSLFWFDRFNHTVLNAYKYVGVTSTMTITLNNGFMRFNSGNSVASGAVSRVQTWRSFPMLGNFPLYVEFWAGITETPIPGSITEFGLGFAATTATPTDGVFFRLAGSDFQGVICQNSQETIISFPTEYVPKRQTQDHYLIAIQLERVKFYKNDVLMGFINTPVQSGAPAWSQSLPLLMRTFNKSALLGPAQQFVVGSVGVSHGGIGMARLWPTVCAGMGQSLITVPDGISATPNYTANYANSAAPTSATLSLTAGGYTTLGGQWQYAAVASTENDYSLFAYQVPTANAAAPGKNLVIRGIRIDAVNTGAANDAATPTILEWHLGVGATAITPATVDSETAGTRGKRIIPLGIQAIRPGAPIGTKANPIIDINYDVPVVCEPGTYVQVLMKPQLGVATASQVIRGVVMFNGYWE